MSQRARQVAAVAATAVAAAAAAHLLAGITQFQLALHCLPDAGRFEIVSQRAEVDVAGLWRRAFAQETSPDAQLVCGAHYWLHETARDGLHYLERKFSECTSQLRALGASGVSATVDK